MFDKSELLQKSVEIEKQRDLKNITNLYEKATELSEKSVQENLNESISEIKDKSSADDVVKEPSLQDELTVKYSLDEMPDDNMVIRLNKKTNKVKLKIKNKEPSDDGVALVEHEKESDKKEL